MRSAIGIIGLVLGLLLQAAPAVAHDANAHRTSPPPVAQLGFTPGAEGGAVGPCAFASHRVAVVAQQDVVDTDLDVTDHDHDLADHNPSEHSHPPGDDASHQMVAHFTLDFAAHFEPQVFCALTAGRLSMRLVDDRASGITVSPPVPPPLG